MQHFNHMSNRDKNSRYTGSFVVDTKDNQLIYIDGIQEDDIVLGRYLTTGRENQVPFARLDTSPIKLGYIGNQTVPYYLSRRPARHYKQGLSSRSLFVNIYMQGDRCVKVKDERIIMEALTKTLTTKFPSFEKAVEDCSDKTKVSAQPFSKDFCVYVKPGSKHVALLWRNTLVGEVIKGEPELDNQFSYLLESLKEVS